jgi:DNA gyrase subunit B
MAVSKLPRHLYLNPIYAESEKELETIKAQKNITIKEIQRNKGLGEMSPEAFKYVLSREDFTKITIDHLEEAQHMLHTCFGKDTQLRKDLLIDSETSVSRTSPNKNAKPASVKKKVVAKKAVKKTAKKTVKKAAKKAVKKTAKKKTTRR